MASSPVGSSTLGSSGLRSAAVDLGAELVEAWGSWGPTLSPHAEQLAFLSDRNGSPQVFVSDLRMVEARGGVIFASDTAVEMRV